MAKSTEKKARVSTRVRKDGKKAHTGAAKRAAQKRVGRPAVLTAADLGSPQKAEQWLFSYGRSELAAGHSLRALARDNATGFHAVEAICHKYAAQLKERGLPPMLVSGAALTAKALTSLLDAEPPLESATPATTVVGAAMAFAVRRREAVTRLIPGPRNEEVRRKFGIHLSMNAGSPNSVRAACENLLKGRRTAGASRAASLITAADAKTLAEHVKAITAEINKSTAQRNAGTSQTAERDIRTAALELFYDWYAGTIGLVLEGDELARLAALKLVPRRPERRARKTDPGTKKNGTQPSAPSANGAAATA